MLLPKLSQARALGRTDLIRRRAGKAITATAWLILPTSALLAVVGPPLGRALFREPSVGLFAAPLALGVVLTCFESVLAGCLNGLGKQTLAARNGLICGAIQLLLTWWRMGLPGVGLRGYVEALLVSTLLGVWLNGRALHRAINLPCQWFHWLVAPGLSALLAGLCANLLFPTLTRSGLGEGAGAAVCLGFGALLYLSAMAAQGELRRRETGAGLSR